MDLKIQGKKALITGARGGLGKAIAQALIEEGVEVCVVARDLGKMEDYLKNYPNNHIALKYDLIEENAPTKMVNEMLEKFGTPDIIVHNVGGTLDIKDPFCSIEDWRRVYRFNLEIAVEINQILIPKLQEKKWGRVIHISSIASLENQGPVTYCSIKAALTAYTRSIGRVVSSDGVSVSAVLPGAVYTEGGYWDYTSRNNPEHVEKYLNERMAIKRFGTLEEISRITTFLASDYAGFIVGSTFVVDGGQGKSFTY